MKGHWSKICRTPKHIVDMYRELRKKQKEFEAYYVEGKKSTTEEDIMKMDSKGKCKGSSKTNEDLAWDDDLMDEDNHLSYEDDEHGDSQ